MTRLLAVALLVAAVVGVRLIGPGDASQPSTTALALGLTLILALVTGEFLRHFRFPRLTGYLLFGVLIGPYIGNVITGNMAAQLHTINGIATSLIALIAGLTLNFERISHRMSGVTRMLAAILLVAMVGLFAVAWLTWPLLPIAPDAAGLAKVAMVALVTIVTISFSPTMTAAVIAETGARGRLSDLVLAIVVLADFIALILFSFAMQLARGVLTEASDVNLLAQLAWEIGGAAAFGCLVGALFALYLRYWGRDVTLVLLGVCALLSQVGASQRFEPLVAAMAAGLVIQNVAVPQGDALKVAIQRGALPVLVVFFVSVGTSLRLDVLAATGFVAIGLAAVRLALIRLGVAIGLASSGIDRQAGAYAWTGLVSQAGITVGLASVLAAEFPTWGAQIQMLLISLIAIDELIGPALFRNGLARAGEIDTSSARPLIVVSNREPYLHNYDRYGTITCTPATGGVAVALDALMRERHGVWIASGDGTADRVLVDAGDKLLVPPDNPAYQLRRLWIDRQEYDAYYGGFANEGLWPLCHLVDVRPKFRGEDWAAYESVNSRFAAA